MKTATTTLLLGDCRDSMRAMAANSIDSIVSDPPYGLSFMGKGWDHGVPGEEFWREALRVAKPGAYLLAFGGTRTFHRLTVAIEDAGWEIRDCIMWVYGSGFPKSHNVALGIDKHLGGENRGKAIPVASRFQASDEEEANKLTSNPVEAYRAKSEDARNWEGFGTALKPAWEPVIVARKPLSGTVAENVLRYGVGGLNIDACRVATGDSFGGGAKGSSGFVGGYDTSGWTPGSPKGRWPANLIHDGSEEVVGLFPAEAGSYSTTPGSGKIGVTGFSKGTGRSSGGVTTHDNSRGSAARFFYCSKANGSDRNDGCESLPPRRHSDRPADDLPGGDNPRNRTNNERSNFHPCVKPTDLMRYLCRLVTPPGGLVLDPFMGSGSTGKAAVLEGFNFVGCEIDPDYLEIARARIAHAGGEEPEKPVAASEVQKQMRLF